MSAIVNARDVLLQATSPRMVSVALGGLLLPSLRTISLTTPVNLFQVTGGSATPTSMTLTATVIGINGDVTFSVTAGTATLTSVTETSCVLLFSNMGTTSVTVRASITEGADTYTDDLIITQVVPGYTGDRDPITVYYTGAFVDGATTSTLFETLTGFPTKVATDRIVFQSAAGDDTRYRIARYSDEWVTATQFTEGNVGISDYLFVRGRVIGGYSAMTEDSFFGADLHIAGDLTLDGALIGSQYVTPVALTDGANIAVDASLSNNFHVTLGGNRTLDNPTNLAAGMVLNFRILQDATGTRTLAYGTSYTFPGGTDPVLSTGANDVDFMSCYYDGTALRCNMTKDYA